MKVVEHIELLPNEILPMPIRSYMYIPNIIELSQKKNDGFDNESLLKEWEIRNSLSVENGATTARPTCLKNNKRI